MNRSLAVIEDHSDNRLLLQAYLGHLYSLRLFADGREAVAALSHEPPELILLDIEMPDMDGRAVLRAIRSEQALARVPVVALTAHAMAGDRESFLEEGFDGYFAKPILDDAALIELIERLLARSTA